MALLQSLFIKIPVNKISDEVLFDIVNSLPYQQYIDRMIEFLFLFLVDR